MKKEKDKEINLTSGKLGSRTFIMHDDESEGEKIVIGTLGVNRSLLDRIPKTIKTLKNLDVPNTEHFHQKTDKEVAKRIEQNIKEIIKDLTHLQKRITKEFSEYA